LRVWLKSPSIFNSDQDPRQCYIYQRVWITDDFRVGGDLDFREIDRRVIMGEPVGLLDNPVTEATWISYSLFLARIQNCYVVQQASVTCTICPQMYAHTLIYTIGVFKFPQCNYFPCMQLAVIMLNYNTWILLYDSMGEERIQKMD